LDRVVGISENTVKLSETFIMNKIPFEKLLVEDEKMFSHLENFCQLEEINLKFRSFLIGSGWSVIEYEQELIKKIDLEWDKWLSN
jgi:hypothetical protein